MDKDLKLWLIEVNMSPACAERQPWLVDMLDDMATGVVNMISAKVSAHKQANEATALVNPALSNAASAQGPLSFAQEQT